MPPEPDVQPPTSGATRTKPDPDAHGQAALLLVESLIHGLIARSALTVGQAIEIVEVAAAIKVEMGVDKQERVELLAESLALLEAMSNSLEVDRPS